MPVYLAYIGVVLIWSTTPLAIAWSGAAAGFVFGVGSRMVLGLCLISLLLLVLGKAMIWHRQAKLAYVYGGLGIYASMLAVYWSAQHIPSGWVSVLFGLTPIFSAILASMWLQEQLLKRHHLAGMALGIVGLAVIFSSSLNMEGLAIWGVFGVLLSSLIHATSAIWIKRTKADIPAIHMTAGSLWVATPLFVLTWLIFGDDVAHIQQTLMAAPSYQWWAIVYLASFGSVLGFMLYFYVLKHVAATRVALISLMTPVSSVLLGHYLNQESFDAHMIGGAMLILLGLAIFELGGKALPKWIPFRPS